MRPLETSFGAMPLAPPSSAAPRWRKATFSGESEFLLLLLPFPASPGGTRFTLSRLTVNDGKATNQESAAWTRPRICPSKHDRIPAFNLDDVLENLADPSVACSCFVAHFGASAFQHNPPRAKKRRAQVP